MLFFFESQAYAHSLAESLYEPLPEGIFQYKMDWDPTLLFFLVVCLLYIKGLRAFRGKSSVRLWQKICFFVGILICALALAPPIDPLSDRLFFVHMIQHMMIIYFGVPLMLFGVPYYVILRGAPPRIRRYLILPVIRRKWLHSLYRLVTHPLIALALFEGSFWFWHIPRFYNWALLNDWVHLLEHACMAWTAIFLWRNIIDPHPMRSSFPIGFRILFLFAIMVLESILSAGLTYSEEVWYAYEGIPMPAWWGYRWDHLDDQRLGGLIMWVVGGFILFVDMTICFFVWAHRENEQGDPTRAINNSHRDRHEQLGQVPEEFA